MAQEAINSIHRVTANILGGGGVMNNTGGWVGVILHGLSSFDAEN
jgi:hypothetical protein